ncbi:MAG: hypothetical protein D3922_09275 [Candidatus Electrothrix sp. AR1]|nr:hypothetical protein [Candidatus Electrothrix sp. AR1]
MKSKAISLKFVSKSNKAVGYLMVETEDENFAKQTALQWAKSNLDIPFASVELNQGILDSPDFDSNIFNGVRVWELPF